MLYMQCLKPVNIIKGLDPLVYPHGIDVPCGKCLQCRISYRREWSARLKHELGYHDRAVFLTLTYSEDKLPPFNSLRKKDLQNFYKKVRKRLSYDYRKIKHFSCGEYGDKTERPHYHAIVFGLGLWPEDKQLVMDCWPYADWSVYSIKRNSFGYVAPNSINYVAQYIDKKFSGDLARQEYEDRLREPVFKLASNGLGSKHCDENAERYTQDLFMTINNIKMGLPRYYLKRIGCDLTAAKKRSADLEREKINDILEIKMTESELYRTGNIDKIIKYRDIKKAESKQKGKNIESRMSLKKARKL